MLLAIWMRKKLHVLLRLSGGTVVREIIQKELVIANKLMTLKFKFF